MESARDHIRELTALFLGDEDSGRTAEVRGTVSTSTEDESKASRTESVATITLLVCGHLPVMTGPWVSQYAAQCAETVGPVGLVRLEGGRCAVEVFGLGRDHRRMPGEGQLEVIERFAPQVDRWMIAVDDRDIGASIRAGAQSLLVLTSCERPAVIRAFELAKAGWHRAPANAGFDIGVVVAGAPPEAVEVVAQTLSQASERHLEEPLAVRDAVRALETIEDCSKMLFDEAARAEPASAVAAILSERRRRAADEGERSDPPALRLATPEDDRPAPAAPVDSDGDVHEVRRRPGRSSIRLGPTPAAPTLKERFANRRPPVSHEEPQATEDRAEVDPDHDPPRSPWLTQTPEIGADDSRGESVPGPDVLDGMLDDVFGDVFSDASGDEPVVEHGEPDRSAASFEASTDDHSLSSLVAGLRRLPWTPPTRESIEVAVDRDRRLHLLARDGIQWMSPAKVWLSTLPADLLETAGIDASSRHAPCEHVFATHAPDVVHLHGTGVRLHLLDPSPDLWRAWPLNEDDRAPAR